MAGKRSLTRLLRVRELGEEQSRQELEVAVGTRERLLRELLWAEDRRGVARESFASRAGDGDTALRSGALLEMELAMAMRRRIEPSLESAEMELERQRAEFLERRTERRQVKTLLEGEDRRAQEQAGRRAQQMLDDWYGRRRATETNAPRRRNGSLI